MKKIIIDSLKTIASIFIATFILLYIIIFSILEMGSELFDDTLRYFNKN
jgi:hypothetical protein